MKLITDTTIHMTIVVASVCDMTLDAFSLSLAPNSRPEITEPPTPVHSPVPKNKYSIGSPKLIAANASSPT